MDQHSVTPGKPATRAPVFFWIAVAVIGLLLVGGVVGALWLAFNAKSINGSGGWGWILVIAIYLVAIIVVSFACVGCSVLSLVRRESHRPLSIVILIISGLVVSAFGATVLRGAAGRLLRHHEMARVSYETRQPPADVPRRSSVSPSEVGSSGAPVLPQSETKQISELKSKLWEAIRTRNADAFVDCFFIEDRFNTPEIRQENRNQVEILLSGETIDLEVRDIPNREVVEIMKIQHAKPASLVRYSLFPRKMLRIQQEASNGRVGRSFLIGEKNGKWYIITMAGHTT